MHTLWFLIQLVFWMVIGFAFLHVVVTHFMVWLDKRLFALKNNHETNIDWWLFLKSLSIEFCCVALRILLYPIKFLSLLPKNADSEHNKDLLPVLFVHGYSQNHTDWLWFMRQIQKKFPIGAIFSIDLDPPFASISELSALVKAKVENILLQTKAKQVILVGHSMGGLVCSYYCEYLAHNNEVARIITLGTPFRGTQTAALGIGENAREMSPNSPFLSELLSKIKQSKVPYFTIASKIDNMIVPWHSALLPDEPISNPQHLILEDHGHLRLLISPNTIEQVSKWIAL